MTSQLLAQDLPEVWHLLSAPQRHAAIDWLGVGEVTVQVGDQVIVETRLPGIWLSTDGLAIGEFPALALVALAAVPPDAHCPLELPAGTMSAEPLLAEVRSHAAALQAQSDYRELIDLSRLPVNRADIDYLSTALGQGPVTAVVATDGECRLRSTSVAGVWWVVYFDGEERELLTTLEIANVPAIASATADELATSLAELAAYLGASDA